MTTKTTTRTQKIEHLNTLVTQLAGQRVATPAQNRAFHELFSACLGIVYKQYRYVPKTLRDHTVDDFVQEARFLFFQTLKKFDRVSYGNHPQRFLILAGYFKKRLLGLAKRLRRYAHQRPAALEFDETKMRVDWGQDAGEWLEAAQAVLHHEGGRSLRPYVPAILYCLETGARFVEAAKRFCVNRETLRRNYNRALELIRAELFEAA